MRTWVIPDVHGCLITLRTLIEELIELRKSDTLIFLGDLIDRGPQSKGVIDYIIQLQERGIRIKVLRGNHEDSFAKVYRGEQAKGLINKTLGIKTGLYKDWLTYGGEDTLKSFGVTRVTDVPEKYIKWIEELQYYVKWRHYYIVHAGFNFEPDDIFLDTQAMMWIREYQIDQAKLGPNKIIHGHVPVTLDFIYQSIKSTSLQFIDLDNGVYMPDKPGYGNLLALELTTLNLKVQPNLDF
jgi:serine/threonine protein phosphatase 1